MRGGKFDADPKAWFGVHGMVAALAHGIIAADMDFDGYTTPPEMPEVLADFAAFAAKRADENQMLHLTRDGVRKIYRAFLYDHPMCQVWNQWGSPPAITFVSRYSARATERQHIDLDAIWQNAGTVLWREHELNDSIGKPRINAALAASTTPITPPSARQAQNEGGR